MRTTQWGGILALLSALLVSAAEQLPKARLAWIFPLSCPSGSYVDVTVGGSDLDEPLTLRFSDPRVTAVLQAGTADKFRVTVPADVPEGHLDVRFVGRFGVSNPRVFAVAHAPEAIVPPTNSTVAAAVLLSPGLTIQARAQANAFSWFRVNVRSGERLFFHIDAETLDSRLVPNMVVVSDNGHEWTTVRRRFLIDFRAPADGTYLLRLNDHLFRGGDEYGYRLSVDVGPKLDFAVPNVLTRGTTNHVALFGRALEGGVMSPVIAADGLPLERLDVDIVVPADCAQPVLAVDFLRRPASLPFLDQAFVWRWNGTTTPSNPLLFTLSSLPVVSLGSNEVRDVQPPCEISGLFPSRRQTVGVTFHATKGDVWWIDVASDRLGELCDPRVLLQREQPPAIAGGPNSYGDLSDFGDTDVNVGDREFNTSNRDAAYRFEVSETATYRVLVRDLFHPNDLRPRLPFRLTLRRPTPDFQCAAWAMPPPRPGDDRNIHVTPIALRRGETVAIRTAVLRRDGFAGDVAFSVSGLPAGVSATPGIIRSGESVGTLLLTAGAKADGYATATVVARGSWENRPLESRVWVPTVIWQVPDYNNQNPEIRFTRDCAVSVVEAETAPIQVITGDGKPIEVAADGKLSLPMDVVRDGEFTAAFNLKPAGPSGLEKAKEISIPEKATHLVAEWNLSEWSLSPGTYTLWLQGTVVGKYRNNPGALAAAEQEFKSDEQALASATSEGKARAEERRKAAENVRKAAEERAKPRDVTVPVWSRPFTLVVLPKPTEAKK